MSGQGDARVARLTDWFAGKLGEDFVGLAQLDRAEGGASNETLVAHIDLRENGEPLSRRYVIRLQPAASHDHFMDADVLKQAAVMRAVREETGLPVPSIYWEEADTTVLGAPFFVMEWASGRVPSTFPSFHAAGWVTEISPAQRRAMDVSGLEALARIHTMDIARVRPLLRSKRGAPGIDAVLAAARDYYDWAGEGRRFALVDRAFAYLEANRPETSEEVLNWGDCRAGNMMFGPDGRVTAILDWENASLGPPEVDLGWWVMMRWWQSEGCYAAPLDGFLSRAETIACYEKALGRAVADPDYYEILAVTRYVILSIRTINLLITSGAVSPDTTMHLGSTLGERLADLLGESRPELSPDFKRIMAVYQAGERPALAAG